MSGLMSIVIIYILTVSIQCALCSVLPRERERERERASSTGRTRMNREGAVVTRQTVNQRHKMFFSDSFTAVAYKLTPLDLTPSSDKEGGGLFASAVCLASKWYLRLDVLQW